MPEIFHAPGVHLHQPPGNVRLLLSAAEHEAAGIIRAYNRTGPARVLLDQVDKSTTGRR